MKKKMIVGTTIALGVLTTLAAGLFSQLHNENTAVNATRLFRTSLLTPVETLDPQTYTSITASSLIANLNVGLYSATTTGGTTAEIAKSKPTVSHQGMKYVFKLNHYKWSDGTPVTAHDFVYSWRRLAAAKTQSRNAARIDIIKNGFEVRNGSLPAHQLGVHALNDYKLEVELSAPDPYLRQDLASAVFLPLKQSFVEKRGTRYGSSATNTLVDGPFTISDWNGPRDKQWTLTRNPNYSRKSEIRLHRVTYAVLTQAQAVRRFQAHQLDYAELQPKEKKHFSGNRLLHSERTTTSNYLFFNTQKGITANVHLRRAIATGFDKHMLTQGVLNDGSRPLNGLLPSGLVNTADGKDYRDQTGALMPYNPNLADKEWRQAQQEIGSRSMTLTLTVADNEVARTTASFLKNQLQHNLSGLRVAIKITSLAQRNQLERSGKFSVVLGSWTPSGSNPTSALKFYQSDNVQNISGYSSQKYDALFTKIVADYVATPAKRWRTTTEAEKLIITKDVPVAGVMQSGKSYLLSSNIHSLHLMPNGNIDLSTIHP
jgi:oligopeptide transport system substrate-binding protein